MPAGNIKTYIIDASFILAFLLPDENVEVVNQIFEDYTKGENKFISSPMLTFEVINSLREASRKRITKDKAQALAIEFLKISIYYQSIDFKKLLRFSIENAISAYDASYVYLSRKENLPLLTLDEKLKLLIYG